jgi:hypothetical protein
MESHVASTNWKNNLAPLHLGGITNELIAREGAKAQREEENHKQC